MRTRLEKIFRTHPRSSYCLLLACAVSLAFAGINLPLIVTGREGVWIQDAQPLYANFLVWAKQEIAHLAQALFAGQQIVLPQYTYNMGYGADVPMTMGSYLQDPINIIPILLPSELIGVSYPLMTWLRMVLAALAFSWYCLSRGHGRKATFVAAIAYVTCGFVVMLGAFRHPKFIDWAILLPLILQGCDRVFDGRKPTLFIVALVLQFVISIYYSYMTCIVVVVYCLVKYFTRPRRRTVGNFCLLVSKFLFFGVIAFAISALFSLPQIIALLSQGRATSGGTVVPLLFSIKYYMKIAAHFAGAAGTTDGMIIGAVSTIGIVVFLLCGKRIGAEERKPWLWGFGMCAAGILVPFLGHVMNGMGYSTDRWMLVLSFVCSYILVLALPCFPSLSKRDWKHVTTVVIVLIGLIVAYGFAQVFMPDGWRGSIWPLTMAVIFALILIVVKRTSSKTFGIPAASALAACVIFCATLTASFYCSPLGQNWYSTFPANGTTWQNISERNPAAAVEELEAEGDFRYSLARVHNMMKNSALTHGVMGIDYYTSYYNQYVDDFRQGLGISDHHMNFSFIGSDSRLAIEDLTGAKYYVAKNRDLWRVPYGFSDTGVVHDGFHVYENGTGAPLAFLADGVIDATDYEAMGMIQKQEALLQGVVVDAGSAGNGVEQIAPRFSSRSVRYSIDGEDGLNVDGTTISVRKSGAKLTLGFEGMDSSETYLVFDNLDYSPYSPSQLARAQGKKTGISTQIRDLLYTAPTTYPITASIGERSKTANPATPSHLRYGGKTDWVLNLGYADDAASSMTVEFQETGDYTFDSLEIVCQPIKPIAANASTRAGEALSNLQLGANRMAATAHVEDDLAHVAQFTFAYTPGWKATVDGQDVQVIRSDVCFLGVVVEGQGDHEIVLTYETPGVRIGALVSIAGLVAFVVLLVVARARSVRRK